MDGCKNSCDFLIDSADIAVEDDEEDDEDGIVVVVGNVALEDRMLVGVLDSFP